MIKRIFKLQTERTSHFREEYPPFYHSIKKVKRLPRTLSDRILNLEIRHRCLSPADNTVSLTELSFERRLHEAVNTNNRTKTGNPHAFTNYHYHTPPNRPGVRSLGKKYHQTAPNKP